MTHPRLAYDDAATTSQMHTDAAAAGRELRLPAQGVLSDRPVPHVPAYETPVVTDDLAALAAGLELHFD